MRGMPTREYTTVAIRPSVVTQAMSPYPEQVWSNRELLTDGGEECPGEVHRGEEVPAVALFRLSLSGEYSARSHLVADRMMKVLKGPDDHPPAGAASVGRVQASRGHVSVLPDDLVYTPPEQLRRVPVLFDALVDPPLVLAALDQPEQDGPDEHVDEDEEEGKQPFQLEPLVGPPELLGPGGRLQRVLVGGGRRRPPDSIWMDVEDSLGSPRGGRH